MGLRALDSYLLWASSTLVIMGLAALALAVFFRRRSERLKDISGNVSANVFNKTFVVFEPYSKTTVYHSFLSFLPFVPLIGGFGMAVLLFYIIESGLLLTVLVFIMALSLIVVEESPEAYTESKILMNAIENRSNMGEGDMRLLRLTRRLLPRLSTYYICLAVFLFALAGVLPYVWSSALWYFSVFFGSMIQASVMAGPTSWMAAIAVYAIVITAIIFLAAKAKSRLFEHYAERAAV